MGGVVMIVRTPRRRRATVGLGDGLPSWYSSWTSSGRNGDPSLLSFVENGGGDGSQLAASLSVTVPQNGGAGNPFIPIRTSRLSPQPGRAEAASALQGNKPLRPPGIDTLDHPEWYGTPPFGPGQSPWFVHPGDDVMAAAIQKWVIGQTVYGKPAFSEAVSMAGGQTASQAKQIAAINAGGIVPAGTSGQSFVRCDSRAYGSLCNPLVGLADWRWSGFVFCDEGKLMDTGKVLLLGGVAVGGYFAYQWYAGPGGYSDQQACGSSVTAAQLQAFASQIISAAAYAKMTPAAYLAADTTATPQFLACARVAIAQYPTASAATASTASTASTATASTATPSTTTTAVVAPAPAPAANSLDAIYSNLSKVATAAGINLTTGIGPTAQGPNNPIDPSGWNYYLAQVYGGSIPSNVFRPRRSTIP